MSDDRRHSDDVLSGLPRTRPQRRNPKRDAAKAKAGTASTPAKAKAAAKPEATAKPAAKPKATTRPKATAKPKAGTAGTAASASVPPTPPPARESLGGNGATPPGADLASTAIQVAGEIVGLGTRVVKGVLGRLPRP